MAAPTPQAANDNMSPQLARLQILMALQGAPGGAFAGLTDTQLRATPVPVSLPAGTVRTFALVAAVANGSVAVGAKSVAFSSSSDFAGTITGAAFGASQTTGASADGADTIGAIAYTRTAGTLYIATLT